MKTKIPTAEELLNQRVYITQDDIEDVHDSVSTVTEAMIEFAKLHVEAALKAASEKSYVEYIDLETKEVFDYTDVITDDGVGADVNKNSILNSYSLHKIK